MSNRLKMRVLFYLDDKATSEIAYTHCFDNDLMKSLYGIDILDLTEAKAQWIADEASRHVEAAILKFLEEVYNKEQDEST